MKILSQTLGLLCLFASIALAQSNPGWTYGQVPTTGTWNNAFSAKQDILGCTPLNQAGGTMLGPLKTAPSTTSAAGFSIFPGVAPSVPNNGDIWLNSTGLFYQAGNTTFGPIGAGTIAGPATSTMDNVAIWANTGGTSLQDSGKALPSGAIVGTTDTQTLSNKTLNNPTINGANVTGTFNVAEGISTGPWTFTSGTASGQWQFGNMLGATSTPTALMAGQIISTFSPSGDLGAIYGQRVTTFTGGSDNDGNAPVTAAVRGYSQAGTGETWGVEEGGLFISDNLNFYTQGVGVTGHGQSLHGGRTWGAVLEGIEFGETYTATAGQTNFVIPNNAKVGKSIVTKNGMILTLGTDYTETSTPAATISQATTGVSGNGTKATITFSGGAIIPVGAAVDIFNMVPKAYNGRWTVTASSAGSISFASPVTGAQTTAGTVKAYNFQAGSIRLSTPAAAGDVIKIWRGDPLQSTLGSEIDAFVGYGTDNSNAISGNRIGLSVFGLRWDKTNNISSNVGSIAQLVCDPTDTYITCDRGLGFQGKIINAIDMTNVNAQSYLMKFPLSTAGITAAGNLAIGNIGTFDLTGYGTAVIGNTTNGGIVRIGDGTALGRVAVGSGFAMQVGSDTNTDVSLIRNGSEFARATSTQMKFTSPPKLPEFATAFLPTCNSSSRGDIAITTDGAASLTWGATATGGGTALYQVWCNGSAWTVTGK